MQNLCGAQYDNGCVQYDSKFEKFMSKRYQAIRTKICIMSFGFCNKQKH